MARVRVDVLDAVRKEMMETDADVLRDLSVHVVETLMGAEADAACGADYRSRSEGRTNQRNGYRSRRLDTRLGTLELSIPKLRRGTYFPEWLLEPRRRSEKALVAVVTEAYVTGVSTRRVDKLVRSLGIDGISKSQVSDMARSLDEQVEAFRNRPLDAGPYPYIWLDALTMRSREAGRVVNVAVVVATGVNSDGRREILGLDVVTRETGAGWTAFLRGLVARGLAGVELVISDAHEGLKSAIAAVLPGASWQRCRTHFMRNILTRVPKTAQGTVGGIVRSIFAQPSAEDVWAQHERVVTQLEKLNERAAELLAEAGPDILAFTGFPMAHWKQIWSNNPQERLNREIRRRTDVVGIFPNRDAIIRLVGAVLAEQSDEWQEGRRYLSLDSLKELKKLKAKAEEAKAIEEQQKDAA